MDALPIELLIEIFSYFNRSSLAVLGLVCRRFQSIVFDIQNSVLYSDKCFLQQTYQEIRYCYGIPPKRKIYIYRNYMLIESPKKVGFFLWMKNPDSRLSHSQIVKDRQPSDLWYGAMIKLLTEKSEKKISNCELYLTNGMKNETLTLAPCTCKTCPAKCNV